MSEEARFISLIRDHTKEVAVLPPGALPQRFELLRSGNLIRNHQVDEKLLAIRVVLFDIYGTLFSSAAGEITSEIPPNPNNAGPDNEAAFFRQAVLERHLAGYATTPYPEVRVEEIWASYPELPEGMSGAEFALRYELAHNPVTPMPGALPCIRALGQGGLALGIVSNAQFFTPLLFKAFFGAGPEDLGFAPDLIAYSYEHGRAKPDPELFQVVLKHVQARGYRIDECLYVGNDMLNDVYGAKNVGMKGALFAGDRQSLRLREDNPLCRDLMPDLILDSLSDLPVLIKKGHSHG
jgi:putative hydrolase of the HAD superfamily